eukprot:m.197010 g.197010  ORF g.197010 m.197010 type:complete len:53 (+) comp39537_c0_seq8:268-426(+)
MVSRKPFSSNYFVFMEIEKELLSRLRSPEFTVAGRPVLELCDRVEILIPKKI